jgi:hypothetical protein
LDSVQVFFNFLVPVRGVPRSLLCDFCPSFEVSGV